MDAELGPIRQQTAFDEQKDRLVRRPLSSTCRTFFDKLEKKPREITAQDRTLYSLCRPERLLDLTFNFTLFDAGEKKVARYQQFFSVRTSSSGSGNGMTRDAAKGGVVWHTQGSGKSLTMVMLAKAIARENLPDYKIVLVTDRVDLDDQIYRTFTHCDMEPHQARSGKRPGQAARRHQEPRRHDDHRQIRDGGLKGESAERERQRLRPGR